MKASFIFLSLLLGLRGVLIFAADSSLFYAGNTQFEAGKYAEAITTWSNLLEQGENGEIRYNLGDAYFRQKENGKAIFQFRKAQELLPRDPDVLFNLSYLRARTVDKIPAPTHWLPLSEKEFQIALAVLTLLAWGMVLVTSWARDSQTLARMRLVSKVGLAGWLLCLSLFVVKQLTVHPFGVVVVPEADVYSGLGKDTVLLFKLHEGAEVSVAERAEEWVKIELPDGKRGWIKNGDVLASM